MAADVKAHLDELAVQRWGRERAAAGAAFRAQLAEHLVRLTEVKLGLADEPDHARVEVAE